MLARSTRLAAGALVLALPLAAAAGCGVEKKRTIKAELASARSHLSSAKAISFSLSLQDKKGNLTKQVDSGDRDAFKTVLGGKVSVTVDPAGAKTLADLGGTGNCSAAKKTASTADISAALKKVNLSIAVSDATSTLGELRLVNGALYAHVDLKEIGVIAKQNGVDDFDSKVDDAVSSADPKLAKALTDVRDGKWLTLDLAKYASKFEDLAKSFSSQYEAQTGTAGTDPTKLCTQLQGTGKDLFSAVKPYIKVTDANNSSSERVLDVNIKVRPALKAALKVVQDAKDLPFGKLFGGVAPTDIDDNIADGSAHGTITLKSGHLTQLAVDIDSIRALDPTADKTSLAGSFVVLDIDDQASQVVVPTDVSTFDVGALVDSFVDGITQSRQNGSDGGGSGDSSDSSDGSDTLGG